MLLWRISNHATVDGRGGLYAPGRWHTPGRAVVYLASSPAGCLIEILVHLEIQEGAFPKSYQLLKLHVPDSVSRERVEEAELAGSWVEDTRISRAAGEQWMVRSASALLEVPSAIIPETSNWLLNPLHPDARKIQLGWARPYPYDGRLFRTRI